MKIVTVVGARPNFMKAAPIIASIDRHNKKRVVADQGERGSRELLRNVLVHTGQHYDDQMSGAFFRDLDLQEPDIWLGVGSASHANQTAEVMKAFEPVLVAEKPDIVIVVGDVNSTVGSALATVKMTADAAGSRPLLAHVESGLRSFDRTMPEEINRIVTDQLADLLFVTEESGLRNLRNEGVPDEKIHFVGNTMIDSLMAFMGRADSSEIADKLGLRHKDRRSVVDYALLTLHRPSNVDDVEAFVEILSGLDELGSDCRLVFPVHPRTRRRIYEFGLDGPEDSDNGDRRINRSLFNAMSLTDPLGYLDFVYLMKHARLVVTDSGGIQEETTCLGVPCVTVRNNTERPVTVSDGTNVVAGTTRDGIRAAVRRQLQRRRIAKVPEKWDGHAAARIVDVLARTKTER